MNKFKAWIQKQNKIIQTVFKALLTLMITAVIIAFIIFLTTPVGVMIFVIAIIGFIAVTAWQEVSKFFGKSNN